MQIQMHRDVPKLHVQQVGQSFDNRTQCTYYLTQSELKSIKFKLARTFAHYFGQLCLCDSNSAHQVLKHKWRNRKWLRFGSATLPDRDPLERRSMELVWPLVVFSIYLLSTVKMIVWFAYQFEYDVYSYKLESLRARLNISQSARVESFPVCELAQLANTTKCQLEVEYLQHIASSYRVMKLLGNPYVNMRFMTQPAILLSLLLNFLSYMASQLTFNYGSRFRLFLIRLLLDEEDEFKRCERLIKRELKIVQNSSKNYLKASIQLGYDELEHASFKNEFINNRALTQRRSVTLSKGAGVTKYYLDHLLVSRLLKMLETSQRLHPITRSSPEWRGHIVGEFVKANLVNLIYSFVFDWFFIYFGHQFGSTPLEFTSLMDSLVLFEIWIYFQIGVFATNFHVPTFMIHCQNQTRYINHVIARVQAAMRINEQEFVEALESNSPNRHYERMNLCLVETFLEYRIFLAQLSDFIATWSKIIHISLVLMFCTPAIMRLYTPYIPGERIKFISVLFSIHTLIFADAFLVPVCHFESKGHQLYQAMTSLLAHAIELQQQSRDRFQGHGIYMENTIEMIRKELNHPEEVLEHFVTRVPGFSATFPNLIEFHFYYSVLNLALYCEIDTWKKLLGDRLNDPLLLFMD